MLLSKNIILHDHLVHLFEEKEKLTGVLNSLTDSPNRMKSKIKPNLRKRKRKSELSRVFKCHVKECDKSYGLSYQFSSFPYFSSEDKT